jgi:hypothetical protein
MPALALVVSQILSRYILGVMSETKNLSLSAAVSALTGVTVTGVQRKDHGYAYGDLIDYIGQGVGATIEKRGIAGTLLSSSCRKSLPALHGLMQSVHMAFAAECDLVLRPDDLHLAIVQQVARQVATNPVKYRKVLGLADAKKSKEAEPTSSDKGAKVSKGKPSTNATPDAKEVIEVRHDGLIKGESVDKATPKWAEVLPVFAKEIQARLATETPVLKSIQMRFSTTQESDMLVRHVALMDVMKCYFDFAVCTMCGIPNIHLRGFKDDWIALHASLDAYSDALDLAWYTKPLQVILQHFVDAFDGKINPLFWRSIYKYEEHSGGGSADGWILAFAPVNGVDSYRSEVDEIKNFQWMHPVSEPCKYGSGFAMVPFEWNYLGTKMPMTFVAGFAAPLETKQATTVGEEEGKGRNAITIEVATGWAVLSGAMPLADHIPVHLKELSTEERAAVAELSSLPEEELQRLMDEDAETVSAEEHQRMCDELD